MAYTSSSMVLQNTDLLRAILEQADARSRKCCIFVDKTFSHYALELTWRVLWDLTRLLAIMPTFQKAKRYDGEHGFHEMPRPQDLERFRFYSRKVRTLGVRMGDLRVGSHTLLYLSKALGGGPLVPGLRKLDWAQTSRIDYDILHFISPSIHALEITIEGSYKEDESLISSLHEASVRALLEQIALAVPDLEALELHSSCDVLPYSIIPFTLTCRDLRRVALGSPQFRGHHALFFALASIEKLTDLSITVLDDDKLAPEDIATFQGLNSLEKLTLSCNDTWSVKDVIGAVGPNDRRYPSLKVLHIDLSISSVTHLSDLTQVLESRFSVSLGELILTCGEVDGLEKSIVSPLEFLRPLLRMRNLRVVTISIAIGSLSWSDDDLATLASAWPKVASLDIRWSIYPPLLGGSEDTMPAIPTLGILARIAKTCPCLRTLSLSALGVTWNESVENAANSSHTVFSVLLINRLFPATSIPIIDVASFLDRLFPHLDTKESLQRAPLGGTWQKILDQVELLQTARKSTPSLHSVITTEGS